VYAASGVLLLAMVDTEPASATHLLPVSLLSGLGVSLVDPGTVLHGGRKRSTAEAKLLDTDGRLLAHGTTTCLVLSGAEPRQPSTCKCRGMTKTPSALTVI
jgi:hypothetical protein